MRTRIVVGALSGAALATALLAVPALASAGADVPSPAATATCDGTGPGATGQAGRGGGQGMARAGQGAGAQGMGGQGMGAQGTGIRGTLQGVATGTLTAEQQSTLTAMAEEEKLAHDLYIAFSSSTGDQVFARVATAEDRHLTQVRLLLDRYDLTDPTAGLAAGTFASADVQKTYDGLVAQGNDLTTALTAARTVESADIADLTQAQTGLDAPDVELVYSHLLTASERHLTAFGG